MDDVERGFDFLRVSVETRLHGPSVVTVTSAREDDGSSIVASGLAEAFADAGKPTLLVVMRAQAMSGGKSRANLVRATAQQLTADASGAAMTLGNALRAARSNYAIVVVDADPLPKSTLAYEFVREADGVIVAIRLGRKPGKEDRATMKLLDDANAKVLGIAPNNGRARPTSALRSTGTMPTEVTRIARPLEVTR